MLHIEQGQATTRDFHLFWVGQYHETSCFLGDTGTFDHDFVQLFSGFGHQQGSEGSRPTTDGQPLVADGRSNKDVLPLLDLDGKIAVLVGGQPRHEAVVLCLFQHDVGKGHGVVVLVSQTACDVLRLSAQHRRENEQCHKK